MTPAEQTDAERWAAIELHMWAIAIADEEARRRGDPFHQCELQEDRERFWDEALELLRAH